jgi:hypothetical protein
MMQAPAPPPPQTAPWAPQAAPPPQAPPWAPQADNWAPQADNSPLNAAEPGEFTKMMQSPLAPKGPATPPSMFPSTPSGPSPLRAAEPGEFTRMLEAQGGRGSGPSSPLPAASFPMPPQGNYQEPGEFTRMLESPLAPHGLVSGPTPGQLASRGPQAGQQPPVAGGAPAEAGGPSEFTKMFKAPPAAPPPAVEVKPKRPAGRPPIPKKKANYALWILIGIAVLLLLVLIIYLVLKK